MDKVMVETSRIRTHCFVSGPPDGVPVLLVHGNLTTGRFWQDVADGLVAATGWSRPTSAASAGPSAGRSTPPGACGTGATTCTPWSRPSAGPERADPPAGPMAAGWWSSTPSSTAPSWPASP